MTLGYATALVVSDCVACGNVAAVVVAYTPPILLGEDAAYHEEAGGSLCEGCVATGDRTAYRSRAAYQAARAERLALIERSAELGYPCRRSEVV